MIYLQIWLFSTRIKFNQDFQDSKTNKELKT